MEPFNACTCTHLPITRSKLANNYMLGSAEKPSVLGTSGTVYVNCSRATLRGWLTGQVRDKICGC